VSQNLGISQKALRERLAQTFTLLVIFDAVQISDKVYWGSIEALTTFLMFILLICGKMHLVVL